MIVVGLDGEKFSTAWSGPRICSEDYRGGLLVMTYDVTKIVAIFYSGHAYVVKDDRKTLF